jgi:hypothetical protein
MFWLLLARIGSINPDIVDDGVSRHHASPPGIVSCR